ncbi:hypothetical protein IL306_004922 [Fusarium sp. DS 682]|nr:hypothetical protein IL306_004922 [Fusarium sp. DS 682]
MLPPVAIQSLQADIIVMRGIMAAAIGALVSSTRKFDETVEDAELKLELDAVYEWLPGGLDVEEVREFEGEDGNVKYDDEDVDNEEMIEYHACLGVTDALLESEAFACLPDIEARDDELLDEENAELDFFKDLSTLIMHNNMQPRVQNNRLTRNHSTPANKYKRRIKIPLRRKRQMHDEVSRAIERNTPSRDNKTPKVEPAALLEATKDVGIQLEDIVECDADKDADHDCDGAAFGVDFSHVIS